MPTSGNFCARANKGKVGIFAVCSPTIELRNDSVKRKAEWYIRSAKCPSPTPMRPNPLAHAHDGSPVSAIAWNKSSRNEYRGKDMGNRGYRGRQPAPLPSTRRRLDSSSRIICSRLLESASEFQVIRHIYKGLDHY